MAQTNSDATQSTRALSRMASALAEISDDLLIVSETLSEVTEQSRAKLTAHQILQLQSIDRISQSLQDLVVVCSALATTPHVAASSAIHLQLAETRSILDPDNTDDQEAPPGSIELF